MSAELSIVVKIGAMVGGAKEAIRSLLSGTRSLKENTALLQREHHLLGRSIDRAMRSGKIGVEHLQRQYHKLGQTVSKVQSNQARYEKLQSRLKIGKESREQIRSEVVGAVAGIGTVLVPIRAAMDFESSMADVRKVVDFDTPKQFKQMEQDLLNMTHKIPMTANELAKIAASGGQLGVARQDLTDFTQTIAKMSVAFDMSAEQAGDSMAKLANVYKIPIKQIDILGDAINHLSNSSPAKASDIVNTLGRVGGVAKQFGLTELQTASLANAFISLGKTPEVAGTAINGMLTKLMTADKQGKKFQEALKEMGLSAKDLKHDIAQNGEQALMDFLKQVNKLPKDKQMGSLVDLFGLEYADDVAVLTGSLETYQKAIDALTEKNKDGKGLVFRGSMEKEFDARSATTANNWQLFKNQMQHLAISIGSVMLPTINSLLNSFKPLLNAFIQFAEAHPNLIKNFYLLLAAFAAFKAGGLAVRLLLSLLGSAVIGFRSKGLLLASTILRLKGVMHLLGAGRTMSAMRLLGLSGKNARLAVAGVRQFSSALMGLRVILLGLGLSNPVGWIVGALVLGAILIATYWKPIKAFFVGFWDGLKDGIAPIMPLLEMIGAGWKGLYDIALSFIQPIIAWFRELGFVSDETAQKSQSIGYLFGAMLGSLLGGIQAIGGAIINGWRMIFETLFNLATSLWAQIQTAWNNGLTGIVNLLLNWSILGVIRNILNAIANLFGGEVGRWASYGANMIDGLIRGISAGIGRVVSMAQNLAARVKSAFTGAMQIHSPSRVFRSYGGYITDGLAIGMNKGANKPVGKIAQLAGNLKSRFTERMGNLRANLSARLSSSAETLNQARQEQRNASASNQGNITIHFNPTINAAGGNPQQIETALQISLRDFEDLFKRMMADRERRAY